MWNTALTEKREALSYGKVDLENGEKSAAMVFFAILGQSKNQSKKQISFFSDKCFST